MANIFVTSDTHFGHANILTFQQPDGSPMRPFKTVEEMDEYIIDQWNSVVRPNDKVYHCGDVAMHKRCVPTIARCNGHKRLIVGNHEDENIQVYLPFFDKIFSFRKLDTFVLTHIPLHPESIKPGYINIHGHVHNNVPQGHFGPQYYNVSVEMTKYRPLALEEVKQCSRVLQEQMSTAKRCWDCNKPVLDGDYDLCKRCEDEMHAVENCRTEAEAKELLARFKSRRGEA